ncbi:MAG: chromosome segregation protein [Pseudozobellia sp.]|nr:chromosome segregation protein [Pseudozobellia sp.]MBG50474.1 chromosome segregation protein [Pseudozobellia sp.]|tara:strand:+ start:605 stop:2701 length:2097 start_codon:yes stop_codon:yes gene_type:complete
MSEDKKLQENITEAENPKGETVSQTEASEIENEDVASGKNSNDVDTEDTSTDKTVSEKNEVVESADTLSSDEPNDNEDGQDDVLGEIDENNAEDAEDTDNQHRHTIPILDYHSMSMENLVGELQRLVRNEKVQAIKKHVDGIKSEFDLKFQDFIEQKKEDFVASGGNEVDFRYNSVTKRQFNEVYSDYREKRNQYYKNLEKDLKSNLNKRLEIIEELKGLVSVEEDMNSTYKTFKDLQEQWRNAGPIPRANYNDVWRTYQHHVEIFYDFLHLNRELRDLDFKHNLGEKEKLVQQAEALATEPDLNKVFRELQILHKIWKEDVGPVGQEHREEIWERFSNATKVLHQRRQDYYKQLDSEYEKNWEKKQEIISEIRQVAGNTANNHRGLQQQIKKVEALREQFFTAGKVPRNKNEKTWSEFKETVRSFNRNKNSYYKNLKKEQQDNLQKKRELLNLAESLKDSEDWDSTTPQMKRIQSDWKKIGHVPRKYSDKIWKEFKNACNHYFDRLHALKNKDFKEEEDNLKKKEACLDKLKEFKLSGTNSKDIDALKKFIAEWKTYGRVPFRKKNIDQKFNKILDGIFRKLNISRQDAELLKYGNKVQELADTDNVNAIQNERSFIRKKIEEIKGDIRQLENNLQFFSDSSEDNPLVQDVVKRVNGHKESLATWKGKLKKLNIMENSLNREAESNDDDEDIDIEEN